MTDKEKAIKTTQTEENKDCKNCRYNCSTVKCWECIDLSNWSAKK